MWHFKACSCLLVYKLKQQKATLSISYELSKGSRYEFLQISMCFLSLKLEAPKNSTSVLSTLRIRVHPPKCVHLPCHSEKALRPLQVGQWFLGFPVQMTSAQPAYSHIGLLWNVSRKHQTCYVQGGFLGNGLQWIHESKPCSLCPTHFHLQLLGKECCKPVVFVFFAHEISNQPVKTSVAANLSSDPFSYPKDVDFHNQDCSIFPPSSANGGLCSLTSLKSSWFVKAFIRLIGCHQLSSLDPFPSRASPLKKKLAPWRHWTNLLAVSRTGGLNSSGGRMSQNGRLPDSVGVNICIYVYIYIYILF